MKYIFSLLALSFAFMASAQEFNAAKLDSFFNAIEENHKGMGSISLYKDGNEIYQNSIGYADVANEIEAEKNTKYRIGSISKTFTAAVILQLVDKGKLSLETKLQEFYPEMPNAQEISIEDMLRHQSGLFNFTNEDAYLDYMEKPKTRNELLEMFKNQEPVFAPGEKNEYSNTNYVLLSFIAEDIENDTFGNILEKRILDPIQLENTYYGGKINSANSEALSYTKKKNWEPATETDMSISQGAGAIVSTPSDLNKFFTELFNGKLLKPETLDTMKTLKNGYGMGLFSFPFNEKKLFGHTGGIDGFNSISMYYPEEDLAMSYISNGTDLPINDIVIGALSIYWGLNHQIPNIGPTVEVPAEKLQEFTGTYGSATFPLKVKIFIEDETLMGQATGQPSFPLQAYEEDKFQFLQAGLKVDFNPEEDKMILHQGGNSYELAKE